LEASFTSARGDVSRQSTVETGEVPMELWVGITLVAAFLQNMRSALQKYLKGKMGTTGATFVRFGFGAPFALLYLSILHFGMDRPLPIPGTTFFVWMSIGGFAQIAATFLLVHLFSFRNFAVGTAYSRTEPMQAAIIALIFFSEKLSSSAVFAIAIAVVGVMLISVARTEITPKTLLTSVISRTAGIGLLSGTFFGLSAVAYRVASLSLAASLPTPDYAMQAGYTLAAVIVLQTLAMLAWMMARERHEFANIAKAWRPSLLVGFVGATASFGWFMAMTLQHAAIVKVVGQVEMLFTISSSAFIFKEHINAREIGGCLLIVAGIIVLLLF
jgi:drug/metabolite transporter (DMT)-like permease